MVDPGFIVETVGICNGDYFHEIMIAFFILGKKYQVVLVFPLPACVSVWIHIDLTPKYRLDFFGSALVIKLNTSVHHAMVGNGN